nr:reverse transcriptase domain-containing protein [Tanacetum cinerariifolium]
MMRKFLLKYFPPSMVTKLRNEITNFRQYSDESLFEAWERYKLSIDRCPNHNMLLVTQIDTFYNGLALRHRDTINAAAGGTFMQKTPEECYDLIENMTAHHNHWDTSATREETSRTISSTTTIESPETCGDLDSFTECPTIGGYTQEDAYATTGNHNLRGNYYQPQEIKNDFETTMAKQHNELKNMMSSFLQMQSPSGSGKISSNTVAKPRGDVKTITIQSGIAYDGPTIPPTPSPLPKEVEHETKSTKYKSLVSNKEKLFEQANTPLTENCSTVLLKRLLEKLRDLGRFVIPCDFHGLESCKALADLGASINLVPFSIWKKLSLPDLTPTRMNFELAIRSIAYPDGIAEDVFMQIGKFTFPADFVVVDYDIDPRVPLILGRPFLRTARALVDLHEEELILRDDDEKLIFHADNTLKYPHKHENESINMINFIDITCEDRFRKVLKFKKSNHPSSGSTTPLSDSSPSLIHFETSDSLLKEFTDELALLDPFPPKNEDNNFDFEADLRKIV